ncbi:Receptor-type tyrosine-protein phosphatase zeta [Fasciola gigantica]|uniref:Receptor-type tyrosine-protein phosphatase zeta n=1 Tax=Fasciola gigantica TaxID=46835 RepID=A0A504ZDQ2_FASGI|nr:Receptor-type tyrosine-protein phosphatase zeta [Fasciola gigantica]
MMRWPDFSAPSKDHFSTLLFAYWAERRCCANAEAPVLIHCSAGVGRTGTFICLDQLCQQVRYYMQPDFEPILLASKVSTRVDEEPIYANLNGDSDELGARSSLRLLDGVDTGTRVGMAPSIRLSKTPSESERASRDESENPCRQTLLASGTRMNSASRGGWSLGRMKRFGLGRKKTHCINVYKTVLWLRSHRSYMVQSEDQYLFIYRYLSHFIQQINNSDQIYENI